MCRFALPRPAYSHSLKVGLMGRRREKEERWRDSRKMKKIRQGGKRGQGEGDEGQRRT